MEYDTSRRSNVPGSVSYLDFFGAGETGAAFLEALPHPVFSQDLRGRLLWANKAFADLIRLPQNALPGRSLAGVFGPAFLSRDKAADDGERVRFNFASRTKQGVAFFTVTKVPVRNSARKVTSLVGMLENVTVQKHLLAESACLRGLMLHLEKVTDTAALVLAEPSRDACRPVFAGENLQTVLGPLGAELKKDATRFFDAVGPDDVEKVRDLFNGKSEAGACEGLVFSLEGEDGNDRFIRARSNKLTCGGVCAHAVLFQNVTAAVESEKARRTAARAVDAAYRKLETVFNCMPVGVMTIDGSSRIIEFNTAMDVVLKRQGIDVSPGGRLEGGDNCLLREFAKVFTRSMVDRRAIQGHVFECLQKGAPSCVLELGASPLLGADDVFMGVVLTAKDLSAYGILKRKMPGVTRFRGIIGQSEVMRKLFLLIEDLTELDATILITGETGTGKELVANALRRGGPRTDKPFVRLNCAALPDTLFESELFGHKRGAFTGALADRAGRVEAAEGGCLFLDEVGDLSPSAQVKLLRFLENKEYERLGEVKTRKANVRILAATNVNLLRKVREGAFRADLYHRLNVFCIDLPPLRDRTEDIPLLAEHFLETLKQKKVPERNIRGLSDSTLKAFAAYEWPGNVRELKHCLERVWVQCPGGVVEVKHLPLYVREAASGLQGGPVATPLPDKERVAEVLAACGGNKSKAASALGLERTKLYRLLRKYAL